MNVEIAEKERFVDIVGDKLLERIIVDLLPGFLEDMQKRQWRKKKVRDILKRNLEFILRYRKMMIKRFREMEAEVLGKIKKPKKSIYHGARGEWVNKAAFDVDQWLIDRQKWRGTLTKDGKLMTATPLNQAGKEMMDDLGVGTAFDVDDPRAIEWIATNAKNAAWKITDTIYERLRKELMEAVADGESIPKIRERVMQVFERITESRAELIARTEVLKASNRGRWIAMRQSGVVEGKQWEATGDNRVCPRCSEMDGRTMALGKPYFKKGETVTFTGTEDNPAPEGGLESTFDYEEIQHPPLHPDCRCTLLAIVKEV